MRNPCDGYINEIHSGNSSFMKKRKTVKTSTYEELDSNNNNNNNNLMKIKHAKSIFVLNFVLFRFIYNCRATLFRK